MRNRRSENNETIKEQELLVRVDMTTVFTKLIYGADISSHLGRPFLEFSDIGQEDLVEIEDIITKIYKVESHDIEFLKSSIYST